MVKIHSTAKGGREIPLKSKGKSIFVGKEPVEIDQKDWDAIRDRQSIAGDSSLVVEGAADKPAAKAKKADTPTAPAA